MPKVHMESKNMAEVLLTKKFLWLPPFLPGQGGKVSFDGYFFLVEFFFFFSLNYWYICVCSIFTMERD